MRLVVAATVLALVAPAVVATSMNSTFQQFQTNFQKEVNAVVGDILFDVLSALSLKFTPSQLQVSGGACESPPDSATSFMSDMANVLIDDTVRVVEEQYPPWMVWRVDDIEPLSRR